MSEVPFGEPRALTSSVHVFLISSVLRMCCIVSVLYRCLPIRFSEAFRISFWRTYELITR